MGAVLTLMFSTTGSLASYQAAGSYPRFVRRLQAYADNFDAVHVCTFDTCDYSLEWELSNVSHHPMPAIPATSEMYHILSPLLHRRVLQDTTVIRTFNITGAIPAQILRIYTRAPVFVSYGYSLPDFIRFQQGRAKSWLYRVVEEIALRGSDRIICATPAQMNALGLRFGEGKLLWLPNFVDAELFRPVDSPTYQYLLFVGRLTAQKNVECLLQGVRLALDQGVRVPVLKVVGQGDQETLLRDLAEELCVHAEFCGTVPNDELPRWYANAWAYILPSLFEGMPKTLLEAMSCAAPCVGSDVVGIRELIADGVNGLLCEPTAEGVAASLRSMASDDGTRIRIGAEGRRFALANFSQAQILRREIQVLRDASL